MCNIWRTWFMVAGPHSNTLLMRCHASNIAFYHTLKKYTYILKVRFMSSWSLNLIYIYIYIIYICCVFVLNTRCEVFNSYCIKFVSSLSKLIVMSDWMSRNKGRRRRTVTYMYILELAVKGVTSLRDEGYPWLLSQHSLLQYSRSVTCKLVHYMPSARSKRS